MYKYTIEIFYSEEDEGYIAVVPELPGCSAFGETEEEALKEIKVAIKLWIEAAKKEGKEIPKPMEKAKFMMTEIVDISHSQTIYGSLFQGRQRYIYKTGHRLETAKTWYEVRFLPISRRHGICWRGKG